MAWYMERVAQLQEILAGGGGTGTLQSEIEANCAPTDLPGHAVYITSDKIADKFQVTRVNIDSPNSTIAVACGVIKEKQNSTCCTIVLFGKMDNFSGFSPGKRLFVGTGSFLEDTPPTRPPTGRRIFQEMGFVLSATEIMLIPNQPVEIKPE